MPQGFHALQNVPEGSSEYAALRGEGQRDNERKCPVGLHGHDACGGPTASAQEPDDRGSKLWLVALSGN